MRLAIGSRPSPRYRDVSLPILNCSSSREIILLPSASVTVGRRHSLPMTGSRCATTVMI